MTDSILRSYQFYSTTTIVPFPAVPPAPFSDGLLIGETQGFAFDATDASQTYGGYVSVKDTGTPGNNLSNVGLDQSNIVQASTSPKMVYWGSSPYVRWSAHNMFLNSGVPATQSVTVVTGFVYTVTVTGSGSLTGSSGASGVATAGSPVTFTATGTTATWTLSGSLTTIQMNRGSIATPYLVTTGSIRIGIPQTYDVSRSKYAIVSEAAATNICLQTEDFTTTWVNTNTDEPTTNNTAPDATATADEIAATSTATQAFAIYQSFTGRSAGFVTNCSVFAKLGTNATLIQLAWDSNGGGTDGCFCNFNISTGAKGTITAFAAGTAKEAIITSIGGGWYRCSITGTIASGTVGRFTISIVDSISEAGFGSAALTDNDSVILWGANVVAEQSGFGFWAESSYIPALTASVTRATEAVNAFGTTFPISATTNSMYLDFRKPELGTGSNPYFFVCAQNADTNTYRMYMQDTFGGSYSARAEPHGASLTGGTVDSSRHQISWATANADWDASFDGAALTSDATADYPVGLDVVNWGRFTFGSEIPFLYYRFVIVPRQVQTASGNLVTWRYNY